MPPRKQPWFRFYVEAMADRKLRRLSPAHRWLWVAVLGAAKQSPIEGVLMLTEREPVSLEDLADFAGMPVRDVAKGIEALMTLGIVEWDPNINAWVVVSWNRRQYASDDVTERTRKHRQQHDDRSPPDDDGTFHRRSREQQWNGNGTHQKTETDTETENPPPRPPAPSTALALVSESSAPPTGVDPVRQVFDAWVASTGRTGRTHLDAKRRKKIHAALRDYPLNDVLDSVRGWKHSPHHRGENDRHTVYNDLELLLRDAAQIERFRDLARGSPNGHRPRPKSHALLEQRIAARREAQG
jgi:hypothetical protein